MQPTQMSSPGNYGRSSHRAQAADATDQQSVEEDHDGSTMASAEPDVKPIG